MPGIVGLITRMPRPRAEAELFQMVESLRHHPSYATGTLIDEAAGVYVGWVARANSFADGMPLYNELRSLVLVFSGEDYAAPDAKTHLRERGHTLEPGGPSYLVHLSEEDPHFPAGL